MGYKLAGFDVLGGVEIDPEMMAVYRANHNPKYSYLMGVQEFKKETNLPKELYYLDILDGSPPCSSFSMAGSREDAWGKNKKFREGQANQVLDDLFFEFIQIAKLLQPKIVVSENVKGLIQGNAKGYVEMIFKQFHEAGYDTQLFLLNAAKMGVPQKRERTFFISRRKDLNLPKLVLNFNEKEILVKEAFKDLVNQKGKSLSAAFVEAWKWCSKNNNHRVEDFFNPRKFWHHQLAIYNKVAMTQTSTVRLISQYRPERLSDTEVTRIQSFPDDYNFLKLDAGYVCGMSVPPLMMERVALEVKKQLLNT
jgi:DNA (cytosine-5)-methyltransferase 1